MFWSRYEDELARKRNEGEHEKQRARQVELVRLQEERGARQEARKVEIQAQIEAERRATEQYRVRALPGPPRPSSAACPDANPSAHAAHAPYIVPSHCCCDAMLVLCRARGVPVLAQREPGGWLRAWLLVVNAA